MSKKRKYRISVCRECKVRDNDSARKRLYQCSCCEEWFCKKHFDPKLAFIKDLNAIVKNPAVAYEQEKEWRREDGHPDFVYSLKRFEELNMKEQLLSKLIEASLDGMSRGYGREKLELKEVDIKAEIEKQEQKSESKHGLGVCPKCSSHASNMIDYDNPPETATFKCKECGHEWVQSEEFPYPIIETKQEKKPEVEPVPEKPQLYSSESAISEEETAERPVKIRGEKPNRKKIAIIVATAIIIIVVLWALFTYSSILKPETSEPTQLPQSPSSIHNHEELANYALSLINKDRLEHGQLNVSLSSIDSGQKHADNMLRYHFFSHWDTNGYKPYMRYTLSGGRGSVAENIAWQYSSGTFDVKEAIRSLEWQMMYDDSEANWGHRDNILNSFHNKVSIGIAYDNNNLYFVQDFENDYTSWSTISIAQNGEVSMSGTLQNGELSVRWINIFYDNPPSNLTTEQLKKPEYSGGYTQGTFVGMAVPSGYESQEGITITAQTWVQTGRTFQIRFNLSQAFNAHGKGVYTLYLQPDPDTTNDSLTSYSFWYD